MEGTIIFLLALFFALPIISLILLIQLKSSSRKRGSDIANKINYLKIRIDQLHGVGENTQTTNKSSTQHQERSIAPVRKPSESNEGTVEMSKKKIKKERVLSKNMVNKVNEPKHKKEESMKERKSYESKKTIITKKKSVSDGKKKKRDIEKFIGENLINKIGIGVLVLGIAFFVNYAIDNNWINEVGRVAIGILSGGILSLLAHRIRKKYQAFSSVLVGGSMAVFYYTLSIGFYEYALFTKPVAFMLMSVVTIFSVLLTVSYNRKELGVLALIGAFSTPLLVGPTSIDYRVLFSYMAIVNIGMLVLAFFKKWNVINILALAFTVIFYGTWFATNVADAVNPPYHGAFSFATLYFITFFLMHIINNVLNKREFKAYEFGLMLVTTTLYYTTGMFILKFSGKTEWQGLFTVFLGLFNLVFAYPLYKRVKVDSSLIYLLIGMVLTFVSLAAPVQLSGNHITLFWATEMVLLIWLGQKSGILLVKFSSLLIMTLTLASLLLDWNQIYSEDSEALLSIVLNKGFLTTIYTMGALLIYNRLLRYSKDQGESLGIDFQFVKRLTIGITLSLGFFIGLIELVYQLNVRVDYHELTSLCSIGYTYLYLFGITWLWKLKDSIQLNKFLTIICALALLSYPWYNSLLVSLRTEYLAGANFVGTFGFQYLNLGLIIGISVLFLKKIKGLYGLRSEIGRVVVWLMSVWAIVVASSQLDHQAVLLFYDSFLENTDIILKQTTKIGYPIVWSVFSFFLMIVGMRYKYRTLRMISLSLFSIVLLKLFVFDIQGASEAGKIIAFVLLGVLLLVISFMYQKLKNILIEDKEAH